MDSQGPCEQTQPGSCVLALRGETALLEYEVTLVAQREVTVDSFPTSLGDVLGSLSNKPD